jgi:hypothetical protein
MPGSFSFLNAIHLSPANTKDSKRRMTDRNSAYEPRERTSELPFSNQARTFEYHPFWLLSNLFPHKSIYTIWFVLGRNYPDVLQSPLLRTKSAKAIN